MIAAYGELDLATAAQLEERLAANIDTVLDLSELSFIDSTGLRVLVGTAHRAQAEAWEFTVRNPQPTVLRVIKLVALEQLLGLESQQAPASQRAARSPVARLGARGYGQSTPTSVGSGCNATPKRSSTPAAISRASASSSAVVPAPRLVSASVCLEEIAIPSGLPWPRWKPARSISHAAEVLTRPSGSGKRGGRSARSSSAENVVRG